ncbi:hypothetical protein Taro_034397 [Colocasia esculenta]|uniref:Uncharacterized protein n=1 Tax=Colocasia esculenta TaxID=4460 RepID=A0A843W3Y1_COLES|nr:hypothetical protein [Colocasia esculenta]
MDNLTMYESRNSNIDIILSNPRPDRVSFLCESARNCSACMSRQQAVQPSDHSQRDGTQITSERSEIFIGGTEACPEQSQTLSRAKLRVDRSQ